MTTLTATGKERTTYAGWAARTRRLAGALDGLGISADARVGTFAWNTSRHLELYFAAPAAGASCTRSTSGEGYIRLVDRTKDLVKSGGEWISSVELENEIMAHPAVREAAVIAVPDERWGERPLACVVVEDGEQLDADALREFLSDRVAKWWIPEKVEFIDEVPKTSVGKFSKKTLRERFTGA